MNIYTKDIDDFNMLQVSAGTTGYRGGDSGHGCQTIIEIKDEGSTDIKCKLLGTDEREGVRIILGGDSELKTIIAAFEFILYILKEHKDDKDE